MMAIKRWEQRKKVKKTGGNHENGQINELNNGYCEMPYCKVGLVAGLEIHHLQLHACPQQPWLNLNNSFLTSHARPQLFSITLTSSDIDILQLIPTHQATSGKVKFH
jgi:hypothetical protein